MYKWEDLPAEILNLVFEKQGQSTLAQCQLTCKSWSKQAQRHLYRKITIRRNGQLMNLLSTLTSCETELWRYLKTLRLHTWEVRLPSAGLIQTLLLRCQNIEILESTYFCNSNTYEEIQEARKRGACKHLKKIPLFKEIPTTEDIGRYEETVYRLRDSLEDVGVFGVPSSRSDYSFLERLKEFPKLRSLNIQMIWRFDIICDIGKYTKSCPGFVELTFTWLPIRRSYLRILYGDDIDLNVQSIIPSPTVQRLDIGRADLTKNILQYIMHAFPNINSFSIDPVSVFIRSGDSINLWVQFLVYLNGVKNFIAVKNLVIDDLPNVLTEYYNTVNFNGRLEIIHMNTDGRPHISYNKTGAKQEPTMTVHSYSGNEMLPHLLQIARPYLKSLEYCCNLHEYERHNFLLGQIFQQCPSLGKLGLSNLSIGSCNPEPQKNTSITDLTLTNCDLSPEFFPELSAQLPSLSNLLVVNHHEIAWRSDASGPSGHHIENPSELPTAILPIEPTLMYTNQSSLGYYDSLSFTCIVSDRSLNMDPYQSPYGNTNNEPFYLPSDIPSHSNYIFKMPNTSFDTLTWRREHHIDNSPFLCTIINLKIETTAKTNYYYGTQNGSIIEICDYSYKMNSVIPKVFSMYIQCHDIKRLNITLALHSWRIKII
jgi:hypothetical protein